MTTQQKHRTRRPITLPTPVNVHVLDDLKIWLEYDDGVKGVADLSDMKDKGVFKAWNDRSFFERVHIDAQGSVSWGFDSNGVEFDLATDVLYANVLGITRDDMKNMDGFEELHREINKRRETTPELNRRNLVHS